MPEYLLFGGENYHPAGGMGDLIGVYSSIEEAKAEVEELKGYKGAEVFYVQWAHIGTIENGVSRVLLCWTENHYDRGDIAEEGNWYRVGEVA